ncbi:IucC family-domain-containing protein [Coprinopsis sp. MPI-PUGE-AT-0042]|nr:IucC family-domain-containing protein [Coprinopsis sp. MPI-PUGE-AT-0042]
MLIQSGLDYSSTATLNPKNRALFATSARLLSCLVTETLVDAYFYPSVSRATAGWATICFKANGEPSDPSGFLAIIPLHHCPLIDLEKDVYGAHKITLLDPLDMLPSILVARAKRSEDSSTKTNQIEAPGPALRALLHKDVALEVSLNPLYLWNRLAASIGLEESITQDIEVEFSSSVEWQEHSYRHPPSCPSFPSLSVIWEQSIVQGHPTHPMHKTRRFLPPMPAMKPGQYDLLHPTLRLIAVPTSNLRITYNFTEILAPLVVAFERRAGKTIVVPDGHTIVPVHDLQLHHIRSKFPEAHIFPEVFSLPLQAQQSLRSVVVPDAFDNLHLKLAVGIKLTSAVRTISPESAYLGPRFSAQVVPVLKLDPNVVTVAKELASVVHTNPDGEIAKHCAALIREYHEGVFEKRGECAIVCTSLVESGHEGSGGDIPPVIRIFDLHTEEKRIEWLSNFLNIFFRAFLPSVIHNGVAFECHPQNCVARFDAKTKELKGFIIRDFGGIRVHPPTLKETTGVDIDFVEGHSIIAPDLDDVYTRMYHTVFHNHLQQLIRVLDLHYSGKGWALVRHHLRENIPEQHPLFAAWLSPERRTLPGKCFMRMRLSGMYRHHLHGPFPNLIHYKGVGYPYDSKAKL